MFRTVGVLLCAAAMACPSVVAAAESSPPASARAFDCAVRYNKAMRIEDTMAGRMRAMMPLIVDQQEEDTGSSLTDDQKAEVVEALVESASFYGPILLERLVPAMMATFSEDELCAMAAFYESPEGQAIITKMPAFSQASSGIISNIMPEMVEDMRQRICRRVGCDAAKKPGRTAT